MMSARGLGTVVGTAVGAAAVYSGTKNLVKYNNNENQKKRIQEATELVFKTPVDQMDLRQIPKALSYYKGKKTKDNLRDEFVNLSSNDNEAAHYARRYTRCEDAEDYPPVNGVPAVTHCEMLRQRAFDLLAQQNSPTKNSGSTGTDRSLPKKTNEFPSNLDKILFLSPLSGNQK